MFGAIVRTSQRGRECLIYKHPNSFENCSVFLKITDKDGHSVATCIKCRGIFQSLSIAEKAKSEGPATIPVKNDKFHFNPLRATHLPDCSPSTFSSVMKKFDEFSQPQSPAIDRPTGSSSLVGAEERQSLIEKNETERGSDSEHSQEQRDSTVNDSDTNAVLYPVDLCMSATKPKNPVFVYKISEESNKCYKFYQQSRACEPGTDAPMSFRIVCTGCQFVFKMARKNKETGIQLMSRLSDGHNFLSCPLANHLSGCVPKDYDDVIGKCPLVSEVVKEKIIRGKDISIHLYPHGSPFHPVEGNGKEGYPVEVAMSARNPVRPMFIYRLPDNPLKCYRFKMESKTRLPKMGFPTRCVGCHALYGKERKLGSSLHIPCKRTDGLRMLSDPVLGHLAGCEPYDYNEVLTKAPLVKEKVKERILKGKDISKYLPPRGIPFAEVKVNSAPEKDSSSRNRSLDSSRSKKRKMAEHDVDSREDVDEVLKETADSGKMEADLTSLPQNVMDHSYVKCEDDGVFDELSMEDDDDTYANSCSSKSISLSNVPTVDDVVTKKARMDRDSRELASPTKNDVIFKDLGETAAKNPETTCVEETTHENTTVPIDVKPKQPIKGSAIGNASSRTAMAIHATPRSMSVPLIFRRPLPKEDLAPAPEIPIVRINKETPVKFEKTFDIMDFQESEVTVTMDGRILRVVLEKKVVSTDGIRSFVVHEVQVPDYVDADSLTSIWKKGSLLAQANIKVFEKKFDTFDYKEDEVEVSVEDEKRLKVVFEKKAVSTEDSRSFIVHDIKLPDYINIDSITGSWMEGFLVVQASIKTANS